MSPMVLAVASCACQCACLHKGVGMEAYVEIIFYVVKIPSFSLFYVDTLLS